jgi:hypothetical protein
MSPRVTRSAARLQADSGSPSSNPPSQPVSQPASKPPRTPSRSSSRKRKASLRDSSPELLGTANPPASLPALDIASPRSKRAKVESFAPPLPESAQIPIAPRRNKSRTQSTMSDTGYGWNRLTGKEELLADNTRPSAKSTDDLPTPPEASSSSTNRRKQGRKGLQGSTPFNLCVSQ